MVEWFRSATIYLVFLIVTGDGNQRCYCNENKTVCFNSANLEIIKHRCMLICGILFGQFLACFVCLYADTKPDIQKQNHFTGMG